MLEWLSFVLIMAVGQFGPGPDMILLTRVALSDGKLAGWATAAGIACGLSIHAGLAVLGLSAVISKGGVLYTVLNVLAAIYLLWLAWSLLKSALNDSKFKFSKGIQHQSLWQHWYKGFLCNILNPKVAIFLAGVVLPFLQGEHAAGWQWLLWCTIFIEGLVLWCVWVRLLQIKCVRSWYESNAHLIDVVFAILLSVLAGFLVISVI